MTGFETFLFMLLFGYITFCIGFFIRRGVTLTRSRDAFGGIIPEVGISELAPGELDVVFEEYGIQQMEL